MNTEWGFGTLNIRVPKFFAPLLGATYTKITTIFGKMIDQERLAAGEPIAEAAPQESVLHHPLTAQMGERSFSWEELPSVPREYATLMQLNIFFPI